MRVRNGILPLALTFLFAATALVAQNDPAPPSPLKAKSGVSKPDKSAVAKQSAKSAQPPHLELAPVSTSEAARGAAREISKRQTTLPAKSDAAQGKADESLPGTPGSSAVDEFKPGSAADPAGGAVVVKESKKSNARNIHGTAYGGLDPTARGNHATGGSVGAASKSGKTSVYVETDSSRAASSSH